MQDVLPDSEIEFSYQDEQDDCRKFSGGFAAICSRSDGLDIQIPEEFAGKVFVGSEGLSMDEVFGSFDEDETWVLVAKK